MTQLIKAKQYIKKHNYSMTEVSLKTGVPERTLYNWFSGKTKPNRSIFPAFIDAFEYEFKVKL